jgi:hypothetical protein
MLQDTWQVSRPDGHKAVTEFEGGDLRVRRRHRDTWTIIPVKLILTAAQHSTFNTFYYTTTNHGVSKFTVSLARPGGTASSRAAMFDQQSDPVSTIENGNFVVTFVLRVLNYYD